MNKESMRKKIRRKEWLFLGKLFPVLTTKMLVRRRLGYKLDLKKPKSLNEKLQWLKFNLYSNNKLVTTCVDKCAVRKYVESCGLGELLIKSYGVWNKVEDIDWGLLPNKFAIKCNHGSGYNIICNDKNKLNINEAIRKIKKWMKEDYGVENAELIYADVEKKIICEEFIATEDGLPPKDYKVFCSYGEPKLIFVAQDRQNGNAKFDYYDINWNWIDVRNGHPNAESPMERPVFFEEMLNAAKKLSKAFPLVRVDFYHEGGRLIFGELTFLHFGGITPFDPPEYDYIFGELFPPVEELNTIRIPL